MGSRDFVRREGKKRKKDAKKIPKITMFKNQPEVEVVKKGKKHREEEEEQ